MLRPVGGAEQDCATVLESAHYKRPKGSATGLESRRFESEATNQSFEQGSVLEIDWEQEGTGLTSHPGKRLGAEWVALRAGLFENGITALREGVEGRVLSSDTLGSGTEEGEAGNELEGVGAPTHQFFERKAASELIADSARDFFVAGAEERVAQILAGFREIAKRVDAGSRGTSEAFDLRKNVPDPVARFASPANLRQRGVVAGGGAGLGEVEAFERH